MKFQFQIKEKGKWQTKLATNKRKKVMEEMELITNYDRQIRENGKVVAYAKRCKV